MLRDVTNVYSILERLYTNFTDGNTIITFTIKNHSPLKYNSPINNHSPLNSQSQLKNQSYLALTNINLDNK
jgi:hypothetical protein